MEALSTRIHVQEQYIKGQDNIVADNFSRLCILDETVRSDISDEQVLQLIEEDETFYDLSELYKVPKQFKKIINQFHNSNVGHHGVERTLQKLQSSGKNWTNMRQPARSYLHCKMCLLSNDVTGCTSNPSKSFYTLSL